mmetsp:Transcript_14091/g.15543  ORF Transcript_14091/g.15543 Transcript_14091/m.15543 type:complete len:307 (+) Transcript_14091:55-975(+)
MAVYINIFKHNKIFYPGDTIKGELTFVDIGHNMSHNGITMVAEGYLAAQLGAKTVGVLETFYTHNGPLKLLYHDKKVAEAGKIQESTSIGFEIPLKAYSSENPLFETYHGVYISVSYEIRVDVAKTMLGKSLRASERFIVQTPGRVQNALSMKNPVDFVITPDSVGGAKVTQKKFRVSGHFDTDYCLLDEAFTGYIIVEEKDSPIKSLELQLVRVEELSYQEGSLIEPTEVQNLQIVDGDIDPGVEVPLYMVFPRLFTSPTLDHKYFKINFEVNIIIVFADRVIVTKNFPLTAVRNKFNNAFAESL